MSDATPDPAPGPRVSEALGIRALGRRAREHQISSNALIGLGLSLSVLAAALLLWAGIVSGLARVVLLLVAAALMPTRLLVNRLGAVTLADGVSAANNSAFRRWMSHWEAAGLLVAGGLCAFGSGRNPGVSLGLACAVLLLLSGLRGPARQGYLCGLYPTLMLGATAVVAVLEPLWGWRGQTFLVGLSAIAAVLTVQLLRSRPAPASAPRPADAPPPA